MSQIIGIRRSRPDDIGVLMAIYDRARLFMSTHGNANQWINGYPSEALIASDIEKGHSYVCEASGFGVVGTFCFMQGEDPTYRTIYDGRWLAPGPYGTIHRLASSGQVRGVADACIGWCWSRIHNLRADTHADNIVMQNILSGNGFVHCGTIMTDNGSPRLAYQKCVL